MNENESVEQTQPEKQFRRKMRVFYIIQFFICVPAAIIHGINWPLVVLSGGIALATLGLISVEKIALAWIGNGKKKVN